MLLVLRLGHRAFRDQRITTHCALVARAFGANGMIYSGEKDKKMVNSVKKVVKKWGDSFFVRYEENYRKFIKEFKGLKIHLTMYGIPWKERISEIRKHKNVLVIIGSEKVPRDIYELADMNIAILNQPHSEVAALAIFLYEYFKGKEKEFKDAELKIVPQERGKKVIKNFSTKK